MMGHRLFIVVLMGLCAIGSGCSGYSPDRWEREAIRVPRADRAYLADDGALLLRIGVERQLQPDAAGWHWVRVDPAFVQELFTTTVDRRSVDWSATLYDHAWADWEGEDANAQVIPPLHEPGLACPNPPKALSAEPTAIPMLWNPRYGGLHFEPTDRSGWITRTRLAITPGYGVYQSERGQRNQRIETAVAYPFKLALAVVTTPVCIVPGGYVLWHYAVYDLFHPQWP